MNIVVANIFDLVVGCVMLLLFFRLMLEFAGIDKNNGYAKPIYQLTQVVDVFGRIFPTVGGKNGIGRINTSTLVLMVLLRLIFLWGVLHLVGHQYRFIEIFNMTDFNKATTFYLQKYFSPLRLFFVATLTLVIDFLRMCQHLIIISFVISWVMFFSNRLHPVLAMLSQLSEPIIAPFRRFIPPMGMFDFAPMIGFLLIILARTVIEVVGFSLLK